jgi:hypothetical protein
VRFFELLLNMRIELAAYRDGSQDIWMSERQFTQALRNLEFPDDEPPHWEANTWYTSYPVYWQNYILSALIAAQVHETLTERFGADAGSNPEVADYLVKYFYAPGNSVSWSRRILQGTGHPLSPAAYLKILTPCH